VASYTDLTRNQICGKNLITMVLGVLSEMGACQVIILIDEPAVVLSPVCHL